MPTITKQAKERELIPQGTHVARCYKFMHLGTIMNNFNELRDTVRFTFELPNELRVFKEEDGEQPMSISAEYNNFLGVKTNLYKDLCNWRGQEFTPDELLGFDLEDVVGAACMLTITHKTSKKGNKYEVISAITSLPKGTACPPQINPTFIWNYNTKFDLKVLEAMHEYWQDIIKGSQEFREAMGLSDAEIIPDNEPPAPQDTSGAYDDDLPF